MCGIVGIISKGNRRFEGDLEKMISSIAHRGPDAKGMQKWISDDVLVGFGHARLSIIDLNSSANQPMVRNDLQLAITYNGEIYNYKEIKSILTKCGYSFNTESDTEVILSAYHKWGSDCVNHFIGMFAFAIYDFKENKIVFFRDRAGVKPLYYFLSANSIIFGSELKSIICTNEFRKKINNNSLADYLKHGYVAAPHTIYENTYKLLPGHYLQVDLNSFETKLTKYWDVVHFYNMDEFSDSEEILIAQMEDLLHNAFSYRLVSDVPVGLFLSGGYDSAAIAAILQSKLVNKINTFSIGFDEKKYDEAPYAKAIAKHLGTKHNELYCSQQDALGLISKLPDVYDEPFSDSSSIPTMLISKFASDSGIKVALSGDGGDEIFNGYSKYYSNLESFEKMAKSGPIKKYFLKTSLSLLNRPFLYNNLSDLKSHRVQKLKNILETNSFNQALRYKIEPIHFNKNDINKLMLSPYESINSAFDRFDEVSIKKHPVDIMMAIDFQTVMADDYLVKVDRASMKFGLEVREPFLDHRIVEYMARVPFKIKFKNSLAKYILKNIVHKYIPHELLNRPKKGFSIPKKKWLHNDLKELVCDTLNTSYSSSNLSQKYINDLTNKFYKGHSINEEKIWSLFVYQLWFNKWM